MAAAAAPWILRGLLGSKMGGGLWKGLKPPYRNPFRGPSATRTGTKYPKGGRVSRTTGIPLGGKPIITRDPGGVFYRNPMKTMYGGLAAGGGAAGLAYGLLSGDDEPAEGVKTSTGETVAEYDRRTRQEAQQEAANAALEKRQPSMTASHREAYLKRRDKRLKKGMKQLLNQYMILSYVSPKEADNFLKAGMKMMETDQEFKDDLEIQDAYDTIFQPGNMPANGREAFARLSPLIGRKEAMKISGEWGKLVPEYKEYNYMTKQRMEMRDVISLATAGDRAGAIAMLIQGWQSGSFKTMPDHLVIGQSSREDWVAAADQAIDLMTTGSATGTISGGGGQILSDTQSAAPAS